MRSHPVLLPVRHPLARVLSPWTCHVRGVAPRVAHVSGVSPSAACPRSVRGASASPLPRLSNTPQVHGHAGSRLRLP